MDQGRTARCQMMHPAPRHGTQTAPPMSPQSEVKEEGPAQSGPGDMSGVGCLVALSRSNPPQRPVQRSGQRGRLELLVTLQ